MDTFSLWVFVDLVRNFNILMSVFPDTRWSKYISYALVLVPAPIQTLVTKVRSWVHGYPGMQPPLGYKSIVQSLQCTTSSFNINVIQCIYGRGNDIVSGKSNVVSFLCHTYNVHK